MLSIGLDLATGHYDAVFADAMGLLPLGHVAGVIGGVALAHVATPLVTKAVAHATVVKAGFVAGGIRKVEQSAVKLEHGKAYVRDNYYILFNKTFDNALPKARKSQPFTNLQAHHILQDKWSEKNLAEFGYKRGMAPTITLETGRGLPHTKISNYQRKIARNQKVLTGDKWSSSLQEELQHSETALQEAGISQSDINFAMDDVYAMLDKLGVNYDKLHE